MNIIFKTNATNIDEKYIVLDLDTFRLPDGSVHTACCVVESIPVAELPMTNRLKELHINLIDNYGQRNWNYCEQAIEHLIGKWGGELDSFYVELLKRINLLKTQILDKSWTGIIEKS